MVADEEPKNDGSGNEWNHGRTIPFGCQTSCLLAVSGLTGGASTFRLEIPKALLFFRILQQNDHIADIEPVMGPILSPRPHSEIEPAVEKPGFEPAVLHTIAPGFYSLRRLRFHE